MSSKILYYNISKIITCADKSLGIIQSSKVGNLAICVDNKGYIQDISHSSDLWGKYDYEKLFDCEQGSVIPGFVDGHTHPVWDGDRVHEFAMKLAGATYMDIYNAGGGIHYSVEATSKASEESLYLSLKERLLNMMKHGTTTAECKTGYGLKWNTEKKMLRVLTKAKNNLPMDISITYLAAHAIPKGSSAEEHTHDIVFKQLPDLQECLKTNEIFCENIDIFCEKNIFELKESQRILSAGKAIGLNINAHADELYPLGGTEMICSLDAKAVSHLEKISTEGIKMLIKHNVTAVLLPTTAYLLRLEPPPVREMITAGVRCALGSDFNPNAYCLSMPLVMNIACINFKMSLPESLLAATINAAHSIGMNDKVGSLEVGKQADFLILNDSNWENIVYKFGESANVIKNVVKKGKVLDFTKL